MTPSTPSMRLSITSIMECIFSLITAVALLLMLLSLFVVRVRSSSRDTITWRLWSRDVKLALPG